MQQPRVPRFPAQPSPFFSETLNLGPLRREEKMRWLHLSQMPSVGPRTFFGLLKKFGTPEEALRRLPALSKPSGDPAPVPTFSSISALYEAYGKAGAHLIAYPEPLYPELLRHIPDPPPLISVFGDLSLLSRPMIAIVGARNGSASGKLLAERFAKCLSEAGFIIVSGLARGIDTSVHQGALKGGTAAILAGGIDQVYPPENRQLYQQIKQTGLIISEAPMGCPPRAELFPRRNRIISGLSYGVLVVEATLKSGSLITARGANMQNRDVFAIPGSPLDPRASGPNALIKEGAILVQRPEEILEFYAEKVFPNPPLPPLEDPLPFHAQSFEGQTPPNPPPDDLLKRVLEALSPNPISTEFIASSLNISYPLISGALVELEMAGYLDRHSGNRVSRRACTP